MSRGVGAVEVVQSALPEWMTPVLVALTQLGDVWFYFLLLPPLYWFGTARGWFRDRHDAALLVGVSLSAFALVVALKGFFALPRPPMELQLEAHYGSGYGFPSGHALGSTAVYGGTAVLLDRGRRSTRLAAAAVIVAVVSFTRVALGVHYLVDVLAGFAVGAAFLAAALALTARRVNYGFALAAAIALAGFAIAGPTEDAVGALAATFGALVGWDVVGRREALEAHVHPVAGALALGALGGAAAYTLQVDAAVPVVAATHAVAGAAFVALPAIQDHWRGDDLSV